MEEYGVDIMVMQADKARKGNNVLVYGSKRTEDFLEAHEDLEWEYSCFMNGIINFFQFYQLEINNPKGRNVWRDMYYLHKL